MPLLNSRLMAVLASLTLTCLLSSVQAAWKVGDTLPALDTFGFEGKLPEGIKGKVVLLDFWASWCAPCKASFPAMDELQKKYGPRGFVILAVNVDEKGADMEAFVKKSKPVFSVVRDAQQKAVAAAEVKTMPSSFLIDREGKVRFAHSGFRGAETKTKYEEEIESLLK